MHQTHSNHILSDTIGVNMLLYYNMVSIFLCVPIKMVQQSHHFVFCLNFAKTTRLNLLMELDFDVECLFVVH